MKYAFCLFLLLLSSCVFALNVELTLKTGIISVEKGQIVKPDTLEIINVTDPISINATKNKLYYNTSKAVVASSSFMIMPNDSVVKFKANHKNYIYKGHIKAYAKNGLIKLINVVDVEDYVEGVLKGEMTAKFPLEALKAQAICIRTFALEKTKTSNYHLCDTHCQQYKGYNDVAVYKKAVKDTSGYVIKYNGQLISAMFSTHCGGVTNSRNKNYNTNMFPYLDSVIDNYHKDMSKWTYKISLNELGKKVNISNITDIKIKTKYNNRIIEIAFYNDKETKILKGDKFRSLLGSGNIKSTLFSVSINDNNAIFTGSGYGHGYGFCQLGSMEMAKQGFSCREILKFYYKGCEIVKN